MTGGEWIVVGILFVVVMRSLTKIEGHLRFITDQVKRDRGLVSLMASNLRRKVRLTKRLK